MTTYDDILQSIKGEAMRTAACALGFHYWCRKHWTAGTQSGRCQCGCHK